MRSVDTPTTYAVPLCVRRALSMTTHAEPLYQNWLNNNDLNAALPGP